MKLRRIFSPPLVLSRITSHHHHQEAQTPPGLRSRCVMHIVFGPVTWIPESCSSYSALSISSALDHICFIYFSLLKGQKIKPVQVNTDVQVLRFTVGHLRVDMLLSSTGSKKSSLPLLSVPTYGLLCNNLLITLQFKAVLRSRPFILYV